MLAAFSFAQSTPARPAEKAKTGAAKSGAKAGENKKEEPPAKIEGIEIARGGEKGFLGVQVVEGKFRLNFYDAQKKPVAPDVLRAALRWDPKYKLGQERVVLTAGPENALGAERFIRPPYNFKLFIVLLKDGGEGESPANEVYTIDFRQ